MHYIVYSPSTTHAKKIKYTANANFLPYTAYYINGYGHIGVEIQKCSKHSLIIVLVPIFTTRGAPDSNVMGTIEIGS